MRDFGALRVTHQIQCLWNFIVQSWTPNGNLARQGSTIRAKIITALLILFLELITSDTKLLLTKNYFEIIIFGKLTNLTRNSLKMSFFPGHFESSKSLKNYENQFSGNYFRNNFVSEGNYLREAAKRDPHQRFRGDFGDKNRGPKQGLFLPQKSLVSFEGILGTK